MKPPRDFRILDLINVLAGPFCCHQLAHMGAEVIKVEESETGDPARKLGADPELIEYLFGFKCTSSKRCSAPRRPPRLRAPVCLFADFMWTTRDSWSSARRGVAKAEWTHGKAKPRFVVTSLDPAAW